MFSNENPFKICDLYKKYIMLCISYKMNEGKIELSSLIIFTANLSKDYWDTLLNNKPKDSDMSTHQHPTPQYTHFTDVLYRFMSVNTPKPDSVNNVQSMIHYLYLYII